ncbi:MAG TPA: diacylglycerol kinase family protein [Bacillaceae bacterium]
MASKGKHPFQIRRLSQSFRYAIEGLRKAAASEKNFQLHLIAAVAAVTLGFLFHIDVLEWMFILLCIFGMFALELLNSAIEKTVDLVTSEYRPLAKKAKDFAAAAVLVYAIMTVLIGILIFVPKIAKWL